MPLVKLTIRDDLVEIAEEHIEGLRAQGLLEETDDGGPGDQAGTETAGDEPGTKENDA